MFFLKDQYRVGYTYGSPTYYGTKHLGEDYIVPIGTKVYAAFDGVVLDEYQGPEGGKTLLFQPAGSGVTYRFLHLSQFVARKGDHIKEGQILALSGNTGTLTTKAHVHFDVFKGNTLPPLTYTNFINPQTINWEKNMSNAIFVHKVGTGEYGFVLPATSVESVKDKALNLGREDIINADGTVDFSKARDVNY